MDELISRAAAIDAAFKGVDDWDGGFNSKYLNELPAIDAVPVVHGRWIDGDPNSHFDPRMRCSVCEQVEVPLARWHYCPNCGAKMDEGERQ